MILRTLVFLLLCGAAGTASGARSFSDDFAVVMIDETTEQKLGSFPYDRAELARAINACARLEAKAVILKFFIDQARSTTGDAALVEALKTLPVALQARLDPNEGTSSPLSVHFGFNEERLTSAVRGNRGLIPLPAFLATANKVGFVDFAGPTLPLVEEYRGTAYKSLILCALEFVTGEEANAKRTGEIRLGPYSLLVNRKNEYQADLVEPRTSEYFPSCI